MQSCFLIKTDAFYKKIPLSYKKHPFLIKKHTWPTYKKTQSLICRFIKKLIFQENRDPCNNACVTLPTCLKSPRPSCIPLISHCPMPTSPNTFSSYPIALNFPSATSASAAPRPCHRPGFQPPPSTRPTFFPTHTDKGI